MNLIKVNYKYTDDHKIAKEWLDSLPSIAAFDFEVSVKYSEEDYTIFESIVNNPDSTKLQRIDAQSKLDATALGHASHCVPFQLSVAWTESDSFVLLIDSYAMFNLIMEFLVTTEVKQIWHNASYDFRHIYYHTNLFPKLYEDTKILSKTLINHVETYKANTGLKELAGHVYGDWGISADHFTRSQIREEKVIKYAATDACATMWLWSHIQQHLKELS